MTSQAPTRNGCVVSYCPIASSIGTRVLCSGGNAVDAAVATGLALTVTYPQAGALGGGGFMMHASSSGKVSFLDYREVAPRGVTSEMFLNEAGQRSEKAVFGGMPVGVPGTVAGFAAALERFGTWSWDRIVEPVIELAEYGTWLTTRQATYLSRYRDSFFRYESSRKCYFEGRDNFLPGMVFQQPDLVKTFRRLKEHGPQDFYQGEIARLIAAAIKHDGGVLDEQDLAAYEPKWRDPVCTQFEGRKIYTAPPPSGGGMVVHFSLGLLQALGVERTAKASLERYQVIARAFRVAYALRHKLGADPDFFSDREAQIVETLLSKKMSPGDVNSFERSIIQQAAATEDLPRMSNTTHFCVLDGEGNGVSNTYSLNTLFGSKMVVEGAGFLLNNTLDDFRIGDDIPNWYGIVDGARNQLLPCRRPVGSMAPTIVINPAASRSPVEVLVGGSGGPMIATMVTQVLINMLLNGDSLAEAIAAPRVHHQYQKPELKVEEALPKNVLRNIRIDKDPVIVQPRLALGAGIHKNFDTGRAMAVLDPRFGQYD